MIPLTPDYADELVNIDLSTRERWIMVLTLAGEIEQADHLRKEILPLETELHEAA